MKFFIAFAILLSLVFAQTPSWIPATCPSGYDICGQVCCESSTELCSGSGYVAKCVCKEDHHVRCEGKCVTLDTVENCGRCGEQCGQDEQCIAGACVPPQTVCPTSTLKCGDYCCEAHEKCIFEDYELRCLCRTGFTRCYTGCEHLSSDRKNCGACGHECQADEECISGLCIPPQKTCPTGLFSCGDSCCDSATEVCTGYQCQCKYGLARCDGECVEVMNDPYNCGSCNNRCYAPQVCHYGTCECPSGLELCENKCVDPEIFDSDPKNCGACGIICTDKEKCASGNCGLTSVVPLPPQEICDFITMPPEESMVTRVFLLDTSDVREGSLQLAITRNLVEGSSVESLRLMGLEGTTNDAICTFPQSSNWVETFDDVNCVYRYDSDIPLNKALSECQLTMSMDEQVYRYVGKAEMIINVPLWDGVNRRVKVILKFVIILPKILQVSDQVSVISEIETKAYLTEKSWTWLTGLATIEYLTRTNAPFKLEMAGPVTGPPGMIVTLEQNIAKSSCPDDKVSECLQYWTMTINPGVLCSFGGQYVLPFTGVCRDVGLDCPPLNNAATTITSTLISDDSLCNKLELSIDVSAELDDGVIALYQPGDDVTFTLTVFSPDALIQRIEPLLITTTLLPGGQSQVLLNDQGATAIALANGYFNDLKLPGPTDNIEFGFTISVGEEADDLFPTPVGATFVFRVDVTFKIVYVGQSRRSEEVATFTMSELSEIPVTLPGVAPGTGCPLTYVNPCENNNGGCATDCTPVACSEKVVCGQRPSESESSSSPLPFVAAGLAGILAVAATGAVVYKKSKKNVEPQAQVAP